MRNHTHPMSELLCLAELLRLAELLLAQQLPAVPPACCLLLCSLWQIVTPLTGHLHLLAAFLKLAHPWLLLPALHQQQA